jgi:hypothetical protein
MVDDLIHNALRFPRRVEGVVLAGSALFLLKSGHALRVLHIRHHRHCLEASDVEGRVAFAPFHTLLLTGPILALRARVDAWRADSRTRAWQLAETILDVAVLAGLVGSSIVLRHPAPIVYWGAVVVVSASAPIWGAKIPHMVPYRHPVVRALVSWTGRLTPAVASVLLHELHHRHPGMPVALLPSHAAELDRTDPSTCAERMGHE